MECVVKTVFYRSLALPTIQYICEDLPWYGLSSIYGRQSELVAGSIGCSTKVSELIGYTTPTPPCPHTQQFYARSRQNSPVQRGQARGGALVDERHIH